ncbi:hypothetical protein ACJA88_013716 [Fusarium oxysporum]
MSSPTTMKAMVSNASGGYCLSSAMPQPSSRPGMMLVRVEAVALNPYDTKVIEYGIITPEPYVGGCDFAGVVVAAGPGVTRFQPGDPVLSMHTRGGFAEYALAFEDISCRIPKSMSYNEACSLGLGIGISGLALFQQPGLNLPLQHGHDLDEMDGNARINGYTNGHTSGHTNGSTNGHGQSEEGSKDPIIVLVAGGASASGTMATQLLKLAGYNPIVTCSPTNNCLCESFGASACFDYNSPTCGADIRLHTDNSLAYVVDCVTNVATMTMCYEAIGSQGGTYIALDATANTVKYTRRDIRADWVMANTLLGEPCKLDGVYGRPSAPEHREFASHCFRLAERWLAEGKIPNNMSRLDVTFKTLDGLTLSGWLYPAAQYGPGIVVSPGFNMPREAFVPDIAQWYQNHGITALIFDTRTYGLSDGLPRQEVTKSRIPIRLRLALDPRVHAVVAVAPVIDLHGFPERRRAILELAMQDREAQMAGQEPIYLPYVNEDGTVPLGPSMGSDFWPMMTRLKIPVENRVTVQTFYNAFSWDIMTLIPYVSPTPAMMVTPENDIECPAAEQIAAFEKMGEPKTFHLLPGKGHLDWDFGDVDSVMEKQLEFLKGALNF